MNAKAYEDFEIIDKNKKNSENFLELTMKNNFKYKNFMVDSESQTCIKNINKKTQTKNKIVIDCSIQTDKKIFVDQSTQTDFQNNRIYNNINFCYILSCAIPIITGYSVMSKFF